ncbi:phosphonate ABC transporter ATP-binding protein [Vibrio sp. 10N.286.49.C2]|uniref:phosphonate ABC transporter ATP-binding protein n=1 Tax=unclassified Vibrio TaxID=2614977 RepID=UPI000C855546|nr:MULTISPECIES: phosphonate ABC transporter ATP-binding protein [unclassified Vibrio]PMH38183.1 phosphonate ABC transporter ATP-binding protein [Vibrio sp. 10N.286.49.C2]PMH53611.1 phosphonate ABC transporter ATP-binding protein [Vibrio sp. 10N.286.49.B1]
MHLDVNNLNKTYDDGTKALDGISFSVEPGEGVIILGHNGCGKSTLMKCLTGIETITSGSITLNGADLSNASKKNLRNLRQQVGCVFQKFNMVGNLSVLQNVLFGLMGHKSYWSCNTLTASKSDRMLAMDALDRVGLSHLADRRTDTLSGGQQQRVAIARMLMQDAQIVFADEPVASLDPKAGQEVMELLWSVIKEHNMSVICVLHQIEFAREFGERFIGLNSGKLVFDSPSLSISDKAIEDLYQIPPIINEQQHEPSIIKAAFSAT